LEKGVAVSNPNALAKAWALRTLVFDKTGTLTEPALANIRVHWTKATGEGTPALQWARVLALTEESHHPLARAMRLHARAALAACTNQQAQPLPVTERQAFAGLGLQARDAQGRLLKLGAMGFVGAEARLAESPLFEADPPSLALAIDGEPLGFFWLDDSLRPEALQTMASVRGLGIDTWLLSGDQSSRVQSVAQQLGFPAAQAQGLLRPEDKLSTLQALQTQRAGVGMVGDGLNDAPVMAAADVSWAMHGSASLAQQRADIYLLQPGLEGVVHTLTMARRTRRILFQNIFWAVGYNIIAIPLAALGLIPPVWAAIGMASSSLVVMLNAARLLPKTWTSSRSSF
jgi:Cu2+-exporting ATPase